MKNIGKCLLFALVFFLGIFSCALNEMTAQDFDSKILKEMTAHNLPSITACIIKDEEIVWENAYGLSNIEKNEEATTGTIYLLASVSKLVVVTAVMQLVERGLMDIDQDINLYLPFELRNPNYPDQKITIRMLLTHSSGLTGPQTDDELQGFYDWHPPDSQPGLNETIYDYLVPGGQYYVPRVWTNAVPGQRELYSNLGVTLLGYIVEFVSGEQFHSYCRNYIFLPLEMSDTSFRMSDLDETKVAIRYGEHLNPFIHYSRRDFPGGQLKSSIRDFSHFLMAYITGGQYKGKRILEESTIEDMLEIHNPASGLCLIWNCTVGSWFGHSGGVNGASTYVEFQKEDGVGLIVFAKVYLGKGNPLFPPRGKIYGLLRKKANEFRQSESGSNGFLGINFNTSRRRRVKR